MSLHQTVETKASYISSGVVTILGLSLTQWATVVGIIGVLVGIAITVLTYLSNKRKNESIVKEQKDYHRRSLNVQRGEEDIE